ncbi:DUF6968 family protein [Devosia sp. Root635]|uniref:DUF6968 family protein n=1 Tax=Devosia sp. Root635 TaxID=1736575 RepID=UPI0006FB5DF2|nr:hypothetical protein ASD80_01525 [Devosia sp. Root635]
MIASRVLQIVNDSGPSTPLEVRIYQPVVEDRSWACHYDIDWPNGPRKSAAHGVDSVQAINLAMTKIGAELYASDYHARGQLVFEKPGNGYGFPVPRPMRDALVGDDAKFGGGA